MKTKLLLALCVLGGLMAVPAAAKAQGVGDPANWCRKHDWRQTCCNPDWRWYSLRLRPYPNTYCYGHHGVMEGYKGTLEPYDDDGLMLPPTSRPGAFEPENPATPIKTSRRPERMTAEPISVRKQRQDQKPSPQ